MMPDIQGYWPLLVIIIKSATAYAIAVAFVNAWEEPTEQSSKPYRWWYRFLHGLPINTYPHSTEVTTK